MSSDTRARMLAGAAKALATGGIDAMTLRELATREGVPLGSTYYHFPGGKAELGQEAVRYVGTQVTQLIESAHGTDVHHVLRVVIERWQQVLESSDYRAGCAVAAAATSTDPLQHGVAREVFAEWTRALDDVLVSTGVDEARAPSLASMILASIEGALVLARAAASPVPLDDVKRELETILAAAVTGDPATSPSS